MSPQPGTRLGPYEVQTALGVGGMGEVYKARDTRLDRTVAIKVLPIALAADAAFRERFDREARALSQLDHPHICALHDVGQDGGTAFLVMQYLEGETLADRLARLGGAPLPLDEALTIAVQLAEALAAAHRAGIVHRDLKPGNVMLVGATGRRSGSTASPMAKILDFGLAKSLAIATPGTSLLANPGVSALPTTPANLTVQGTILGTFQYMAPEQLEGQDADARTDIFAFGALLYEMLTGRKAFAGKSHASLVGAIMTATPPPVSSAQPLTPPMLDHVVSRCLAKDPDERWQSASDLMRELQWVRDSARSMPGVAADSGAPSPTAVPWRRMRPVPVLLGAAAGAAAMAVAAWAWNAARADAPRSREVSRFAVQMSTNDMGTVTTSSNVWISRDGRSVVFLANDTDGVARLHVRRLNDVTPTPLKGTDQGGHVSFSPDGQWIAFVANEQLLRVSLAGGAPVPIALLGAGAAGTSWGDDGTIFVGGTEGLRRVSANGGTPELVTKVDPKSELGHRFPKALPGGRAVAYARMTGTQAEQGRVVVRDLRSGTEHDFGRGSYPRLAPGNTLIFAGDGFGLWAVRFDPASLAPLGEAVPVFDGVNNNLGGQSLFDIAESGTLVYRIRRSGTQEIVWLNGDGSITAVTPDRLTGVYHPPLVVSPDETRMAITAHPDGGGDQVVIIDLARAVRTPLLSGGRMDSRYPAWIPDGSGVAFSTSKDGSWDMYTLRADSAAPTPVVSDKFDEIAPTWSTIGRTLAFQRGDIGALAPGGGGDIWELRNGKAAPLVATQFAEVAPTFSPDGRWLAYTSSELGSPDVYVQPYPGPGARTRVSSGGEAPRWSRDGRTLYFRQGPDALMAVDVTTAPALRIGRPRVVVRAPFDPERPFPNYDVLSDGRIIALIDRDPAAATFVLIENWDVELASKLR